MTTQITGILLCGGEGRRMGGVDKPLQLLHGTPLVAHAAARLAPQVARVLVSCNRNQAQYARFGDACVEDAELGLGPLGGLVSVLTHVQTSLAFVCPGDAPFLHDALVTRLLFALQHDDGAQLAVANDGTRVQPLFMLLRGTCRPALQTYLASGARSVIGWQATQPHVVVPCADIADSFASANTVEELQSLAAQNPRAG